MIGTSHSDISRHAVDAPRRHHGLASAAGVSLTELLMSVTLFSITVVGAIGAINAIDTVTTSYISEGEQREANHADFSNAYDRISQQQDPLPPPAEQADFGLSL
jgi:Tfp pilus assembly protein PilV